MTSFLVDLNVWLALTISGHVLARAAQEWLSKLPKPRTRLLFCRITQLGLLRLLTNARTAGPQNVLTVADAFGVYDRWLRDPRVEFVPEPHGTELLFRDACAPFEMQPATKAIMDAYLVGFAEKERATVVTADRGLANLARIRQIPVTLVA